MHSERGRGRPAGSEQDRAADGQQLVGGASEQGSWQLAGGAGRAARVRRMGDDGARASHGGRRHLGGKAGGHGRAVRSSASARRAGRLEATATGTATREKKKR